MPEYRDPPGGRRPPGRRPPGGGPPRRPPGPGGMGNPHDEGYFYEGFRDPGQGEPRPRDVVVDPLRNPNLASPAQQETVNAWMSRFRDELEGRTSQRPFIFFTKRPAFVEPPFFSKPLIKSKSTLAVAAGATGTIFDYELADRERLVVAAFGLDVAPLAPLMNQQLEFWFQRGTQTGGTSVPQAEVIPIFDDQDATAYNASVPVRRGRTTVLPGSVAEPWCLLSNGLQFQVLGRSRLQMLVENKSAVTINVRGVLGFYQYWAGAPGGATQFESGDLQV